MRCEKCNVDLAENVTRCPLCGAQASQCSPEISGFTVSEYPKVQYKKYPFRWGGAALIIFVVASAFAFIYDLKVNKSYNTALTCQCIMLILWGVLLRPALIRHRSFASYVTIAGVSVLPLLVHHLSKPELLNVAVPYILAAVSAIIGIAMITRRQKNRAVVGATHVLAFLVLSVALTIYNLFSFGALSVPCVVALCIPIAVFVVLTVRAPRELVNELRARFLA